jgi:hypothetical protein
VIEQATAGAYALRLLHEILDSDLALGLVPAWGTPVPSNPPKAYMVHLKVQEPYAITRPKP